MENETTRHTRVFGDPPLFQAFYRVQLTRSNVGWHCASPGVPSVEYAVRHALLDAERHRLHNMQAQLEMEYRGESPFGGYPCRFIEYAIVRLKKPPFWCCPKPEAMGTVLERFGVDLSKHNEQPPYEIAVPLEDE